MVLGDGYYAKTFAQNLKHEVENGQVLLVGQTNRVPDYLAASDVFVFPSYHENLSIALLEACKMSLPCIVSNVGGNSEIVSDNENGFVVDGFEASDYAEKMLYFINNRDKITEMGKVAKQVADAKFSLDTMCSKIDEVYRDALSN